MSADISSSQLSCLVNSSTPAMRNERELLRLRVADLRELVEKSGINIRTKETKRTLVDKLLHHSTPLLPQTPSRSPHKGPRGVDGKPLKRVKLSSRRGQQLRGLTSNNVVESEIRSSAMDIWNWSRQIILNENNNTSQVSPLLSTASRSGNSPLADGAVVPKPLVSSQQGASRDPLLEERPIVPSVVPPEDSESGATLSVPLAKASTGITPGIPTENPNPSSPIPSHGAGLGLSSQNLNFSPPENAPSSVIPTGLGVPSSTSYAPSSGNGSSLFSPTTNRHNLGEFPATPPSFVGIGCAPCHLFHTLATPNLQPSHRSSTQTSLEPAPFQKRGIASNTAAPSSSTYSITLARGVQLHYSDTDLQQPQSFSGLISRPDELFSFWDDSSPYWKGDGCPLVIRGLSVAMKHWDKFYHSFKCKDVWETIKQNWANCRILMEEYQHLGKAGFELKWSRSSGLVSSLQIVQELRSSSRKRDDELVLAAHQVYPGEIFDKIFSYRKNGRRVVMTDSHGIAKKYLSLQTEIG